MILEKYVAKSVRKLCKKLYDKVGPSAVYDYCNKVGLEYSYCFGCEDQTPTIETKKTKECAVCGQSKQ